VAPDPSGTSASSVAVDSFGRPLSSVVVEPCVDSSTSEPSLDPSAPGTSAPDPETGSSPVSVPSTGATSPIGVEPSLGTASSGAGVVSTGTPSVASTSGAGTSGETAGASAGRAARKSSGLR